MGGQWQVVAVRDGIGLGLMEEIEGAQRVAVGRKWDTHIRCSANTGI